VIAVYEFTPEMREISGFGGAYEDMCRKMVVAGLEWFDAHPNADPHYHGYKNIYGIIDDCNEDAKELDKAIFGICPDCTGAMHQATVSHVLWIHGHSWDEYVKKMVKDK
jgi:hypothetical protein